MLQFITQRLHIIVSIERLLYKKECRKILRFTYKWKTWNSKWNW